MVLGSNTSGHLYDTTFTADGVLYADASGVITSTAAGTATNVLTSNGPGVAPTFQAAGGSAPAAFLAVFTGTGSNVTGDGTTYQVPFDSVLVDTASAFTTGASAHYTFPTTGTWMISAYVCYSTDVTSGNLVFNDLIFTSTSYRDIQTIIPANGQFLTFGTSTLVNVTATNTLLINATNAGGAAGSTSILGGGPPYLTFISGYFVRA